MTAITIRPATPADLPFIYGLSPRLAGVGRLPWRTAAEIRHFQDSFMKAALETPPAGAATFIAAAADGAPLGFLHVEPARDIITETACGYIPLLAVIKAAEGRGIAKRLMRAAEDWARVQGWRFLSLEVFASNDRGRAFYDRAGYREESLRLLKEVNEVGR
ncbi:MAG TPA: N-acetyltransferase [Azospirillaceae bacterium]|nr:N-acetyltransferase [Azospirillaceae bacterium]